MSLPNFETVINTTSTVFDATIVDFRCSGKFGQNIVQKNESTLHNEVL